jgi:hypothetical protein
MARRCMPMRLREARPIPASRPARVREAKRRLEEELRTECTANAAYRARGVMKNARRFGSPPKPYEPPAQPTAKISLTDPDSRNLKTPRACPATTPRSCATARSSSCRRTGRSRRRFVPEGLPGPLRDAVRAHRVDHCRLTPSPSASGQPQRQLRFVTCGVSSRAPGRCSARLGLTLRTGRQVDVWRPPIRPRSCTRALGGPFSTPFPTPGPLPSQRVCRSLALAASGCRCSRSRNGFVEVVLMVTFFALGAGDYGAGRAWFTWVRISVS